MRVTLTQDELFEAISDYMRDKMNLDNTASIEISFTAGRSPKGYTADVEITYPKSATASKITAKPHNDDEAASAADAQEAVAITTLTDANAVQADPSAAVPKDNLFQ